MLHLHGEKEELYHMVKAETAEVESRAEEMHLTCVTETMSALLVQVQVIVVFQLSRLLDAEIVGPHIGHDAGLPLRYNKKDRAQVAA